MKLINGEKLIANLNTELNEAGDKAPEIVISAIIGLVERQDEVKVPDRREPDRSTQSGYFFDQGWNACIDEIVGPEES